MNGTKVQTSGLLCRFRIRRYLVTLVVRAVGASYQFHRLA